MRIAMKNYDDLQRFKDKTRTGAIDFKDMSAQTQQLNTGSWAIIKQLSGSSDDSVLAQAGSVAVPVPQAVKPGAFDAAFAKPAPHQATESAAAPRSIMGSLNAATPVEKAGQPPLEEEKPAAAPRFEQPAPAAPAPEPLKQFAAPQPAGPVRFEQLFAAKTLSATTNPAKDLPLQPLLEMIASCR
jgi:hypothetical protein